VAQQPRFARAHQLLGKLYREHLDRPTEAFVHEGKARSLRVEMQTQRQASVAAVCDRRPSLPEVSAVADRRYSVLQEERRQECLRHAEIPPAFGPEVDPKQVITVVSGLPRSGTSMMMQLLAAGGIEPLTDNKRAADEDNPLGYYEFEKVLELAKDRSWLPQARGKVVKIVAQLLPHLPSGEHYQIVFMHRDLKEIVASQHAMLKRLGRPESDLDDERLTQTFSAQVRRVRTQLGRRHDVRVLDVHYGNLLADTAAGVERVARFLGSEFDRDAAAASVRPDLRRQKS